MKSERDGINPAAKPTGTGCVECSALGGWWLHLRRCAECGHIGCCDTSPNQHASKHNAATGHPIITSFEPGERWFYDYRTEEFFAGPKLHTPHSRPLDRRGRCLQTGKRCFTNSGRALWWDRKPGSRISASQDAPENPTATSAINKAQVGLAADGTLATLIKERLEGGASPLHRGVWPGCRFAMSAA
jgi:hypothetical protein